MKTERLIAIIMVLLEHEQISAVKLANMFEVSVRTIYRDIDSLGQAGIPVSTQTGSKGGVRIMKNYTFGKNFFTASDITSLLIALENLSSDISPAQLSHTLEKIKTLIPAQFLDEISFKTNQFAIDLTPWTSNQAMQPYLETIKTGLDRSQLITFAYEDGKGNKTNRVIEPYRLVLKEISWYLQGFCTEKQDFRTFKLSRMSALKLLPDSFSPKDFKPLPLGRTPWGKQPLMTITLKIKGKIKDQLIDKFGALTFTEQETSDWLLVDLPFMADDYGYHLLLGFGTDCECVAPSFVRMELAKRIKQLAAIYDHT